MLVTNFCMDIFHNLGISVHKCLFPNNCCVYVIHCQLFFMCVCMCTSQVCIPEECFLYLVSVNIFSFYIFCMCIVYFSFWFFFLFCYVLFSFVCIGVSSLASLSHLCGTDFVKNILLCFTVLSSLVCLYVVGFCYQEIWWLHICVWGVAKIKWCNAVCSDRLLVNWKFLTFFFIVEHNIYKVCFMTMPWSCGKYPIGWSVEEFCKYILYILCRFIVNYECIVDIAKVPRYLGVCLYVCFVCVHYFTFPSIVIDIKF